MGPGGPEGPKGPTGRHFRGPKGAHGAQFFQKVQFSVGVSFFSATHRNGLGAPGAQGATRGPVGPHGPPWSPTGPHGAPWGPRGPLGAPWAPWGPRAPRAPRMIILIILALSQACLGVGKRADLAPQRMGEGRGPLAWVRVQWYRALAQRCQNLGSCAMFPGLILSMVDGAGPGPNQPWSHG